MDMKKIAILGSTGSIGTQTLEVVRENQDIQVIALITIDEPEGIYYGGTIAAPVIGGIFDNILPYLGIERDQSNS